MQIGHLSVMTSVMLNGVCADSPATDGESSRVKIKFEAEKTVESHYLNAGYLRDAASEESRFAYPNTQTDSCLFLKDSKITEIFVKEEWIEEDDNPQSEPYSQDNPNTAEEQPSSRFRKYTCDLCPKTFKRRYRLNVHREEEHDKKPVECEICGKTFAHKMTLKRHTRRFHSLSVTDAFPYACEICDQRFNVPKKLSDHKKAHENPDTFKCKDCGKVYANSFALKRHSNRHSSVRHKCRTCKKTYKTAEDLQKHVGIHTGKFWCDVCFKVFSAKGMLTAHKKNHLQEHVYVCEVCGQCFKCNLVRMGHQLKCLKVSMKEDDIQLKEEQT